MPVHKRHGEQAGKGLCVSCRQRRRIDVAALCRTCRRRLAKRKEG